MESGSFTIAVAENSRYSDASSINITTAEIFEVDRMPCKFYGSRRDRLETHRQETGSHWRHAEEFKLAYYMQIMHGGGNPCLQM